MMAYLMFRYQLLYVYTPQYETGGSFFADFVFDKIILSLLIQQATMLGYLLLKQAYLAVLIVSLPTIVATVVFRNYCWSAIGKKVQTWGDNGPGLIKIMRLIESTTSKDGELENVSDGGSSSNSGTSSSSTSVSGSPKSKQKSSKDETLLDIDVLSASIQTLHDAHTEEETAFNEEYDPQTYSHPVFHHPLKQLWLPNKAADSFERAFKLNK
jgi:hypothetical protein